MWVCTQTPTKKSEDMLIQTFQEDGSLITTGRVPQVNDYVVVDKTCYKVFGDMYMVFGEGEVSPLVFKFNIASDATALGDMMAVTGFMKTKKGVVEATSSWLRINQSLDLAGKKYDHIKTFVTNVKGLDKDIDVMGFNFNFAKMDGVKLNKMLKTLLFAVDFPNANTIRYNYFYNGKNNSLEAPIVVDGNKMTVKMSKKTPLFKDVDLYTFQDADASQMHMSTSAFINFYGNMQASLMAQVGQLDLTDAKAVNAIYDTIDNAVETINLSLVMEKSN